MKPGVLLAGSGDACACSHLGHGGAGHGVEGAGVMGYRCTVYGVRGDTMAQYPSLRPNTGN